MVWTSTKFWAIGRKKLLCLGNFFSFFPISSMFSAFWRVSTLLESSFPIPAMRLPSYSEYSATSSSKAGDDGWIVGFKIYRWGIGLSEENSFSAGYLSVVGNVAILVFFQSGRLCKQPESLQDMTHVIYMVLGSPICVNPPFSVYVVRVRFEGSLSRLSINTTLGGSTPGSELGLTLPATGCSSTAWNRFVQVHERLFGYSQVVPRGNRPGMGLRYDLEMLLFGPRPGVSSVGNTFFFHDFSCWSWWVLHRHSLESGLPSQATNPTIFVAPSPLCTGRIVVNNPGEELIVGISHLHATFQLDHAISGWEDQTCRTLKSVPKLRRTPLSRRFEREKFSVEFVGPKVLFLVNTHRWNSAGP